jgi:hypothetical protein
MVTLRSLFSPIMSIQRVLRILWGGDCMIAATFPRDRTPQIFDKRPSISDGAWKLARWGRIVYWTGVIFAVLILGIAMMFALLDNEPIFQRAASVVVLGIVAALIIWGSGLIVFIILKAASAVYGRTATALQRSSAPKKPRSGQGSQALRREAGLIRAVRF